MRTLFVPAAGSWSFPPQQPPVAWVLPPGSDGGSIYLFAQTSGSTPVDGEGVQFTVVLDGGAPYVSACMENGSDTVIVPPGTLTIDITVVTNCNGGADPTNYEVSAVSN